MFACVKAGSVVTVGAPSGVAAAPAESRMVPWRGEVDFGPDAGRLRRWLAEISVAELRDITFEGSFRDALVLVGERYRRSRGNGLSFVVRAGDGNGPWGAGPAVRLGRRSTTLSRAMDDLCRQADLFWELTPIGIVFFDGRDLEQSGRRVGSGDLAREVKALAAAQAARDEAGVWRHAEGWARALGERRGVPEEADRFLEVPDVHALDGEELRRGFEAHFREMQSGRWWKVGLDPASLGRLPREVAEAIRGCMAADRAGLPGRETMLQFARGAGDYLMWTQELAGDGPIPLPFYRGGDGSFREAAATMARAAATDGAVQKGWLIADPGDGFLQVDSGLCGAALFELYEQSKEPKYFDTGSEAAVWCQGQRVVPRWAQNSHSIFLLTWAYDVSGDWRYLNSAKEKVRLGILPGQILRGALAGRWADPESAGAAPHFTIVRTLASMVEVMPHEDPDRPMIVGALRAALRARQSDFRDGRVPESNSALDALVAVERVRLLKPDLREFEDCGVTEALQGYERIGAAALRAGRAPFGAVGWGRLLELRLQGARLAVPVRRAKRK